MWVALQFLLLSISISWNNIDALLKTHSLRMVRGWWLLESSVGCWDLFFKLFYFLGWIPMGGNAHSLVSFAPIGEET